MLSVKDVMFNILSCFEIVIVVFSMLIYPLIMNTYYCYNDCPIRENDLFVTLLHVYLESLTLLFRFLFLRFLFLNKS